MARTPHHQERITFGNIRQRYGDTKVSDVFVDGKNVGYFFHAGAWYANHDLEDFFGSNVPENFPTIYKARKALRTHWANMSVIYHV